MVRIVLAAFTFNFLIVFLSGSQYNQTIPECDSHSVINRLSNWLLCNILYKIKTKQFWALPLKTLYVPTSCSNNFCWRHSGKFLNFLFNSRWGWQCGSYDWIYRAVALILVRNRNIFYILFYIYRWFRRGVANATFFYNVFSSAFCPTLGHPKPLCDTLAVEWPAAN